jgi:hypothetical protein
MTIGDPETFAIESSIFEAYEGFGQMALGSFVIHVGGRSYGSKEPDATLLGTAFNDVRRRIDERGNHKSSLPPDADAISIAIAFRHENYLGNMDDARLYGIPWRQFFKTLNSNGCIWAPNNEQGFDDGSCVLHFDEGNTVRLIAFYDVEGYQVEQGSLRDVRLRQNDFYGILEEWHTNFENDWMSMLKVA